MTTLLGMPFFLADKTGSLYGSDYTDLYGRMALRITRTQQTRQRNAYMIFSITDVSSSKNSHYPQAALDFGPDHTSGTVSIGPSPHTPIEQYLVKSAFKGNNSSRKFVASDGQEYWWRWRKLAQDEWTCCNKNGYVVASYNLKIPGEPAYCGTSGCMLTIEEAYPHLASEILATLIIMRHLAATKKI